MKRTLVATAAALLVTMQPALAQSGADGTDPNRAVATETGTGSQNDISSRSWSNAVRDAFFTDASMQSLRPTGEIAERWAAVDQSTKDVAIRDCQAYLMDAGSMGGASTGGLGGALTTDATETPDDPSPEADGVPSTTDTTTSSTEPASPGNSPVWTQACSLVTSCKP